MFSSKASCVKERIFPLTDLDSSDLGKSWLKMQHNGVKMVFMKRFDEIFFKTIIALCTVQSLGVRKNRYLNEFSVSRSIKRGVLDRQSLL